MKAKKTRKRVIYKLKTSVLKEWMNKTDVTTTELAVRMGAHFNSARNWIAGRTCPHPTQLEELAVILGVNTKDLLK